MGASQLRSQTPDPPQQTPRRERPRAWPLPKCGADNHQGMAAQGFGQPVFARSLYSVAEGSMHVAGSHTSILLSSQIRAIGCTFGTETLTRRPANSESCMHALSRSPFSLVPNGTAASRAHHEAGFHEIGDPASTWTRPPRECMSCQ
jgi:hypothetical protein